MTGSALSSFPRRTEIANAMFSSLGGMVGDLHNVQANLSAPITSLLKKMLPILFQAVEAVYKKLEGIV